MGSRTLALESRASALRPRTLALESLASAPESRQIGTSVPRYDGATELLARWGGALAPPLEHLVYLHICGQAEARGTWGSVRSARPNFVNLGRVLSIWARFLSIWARFLSILASILSIWDDFCQFGPLFCQCCILGGPRRQGPKSAFFCGSRTPGHVKYKAFRGSKKHHFWSHKTL